MDRRSFIRASSLAAAAAATPAWADPAKLDDLTVVRRALALHPGLYRYLSPRQFAARLDQFNGAWRAAPDQAGRFLALSRLLAQIRCGHTQCNPFNQSDAVVADLFDRPTRLPFAFRWLGQTMVVLGDSGGQTGIARGSVIEQINGIPPARLLTSLMPYARADGGNDAKRRALLEMRGDEAFETFDIFQGLLFPPGRDGHQLAWRDPAGRRHRAVLPAISYGVRKALLPPEPAADASLWDWRIDSQGIATLTMPSWVTYRGNWNWQAWLTERFASLSGARGLVIDIRRNEGGTDVGTWLLQRLIDRPFAPLRYVNKVRFRTVEPDLVPYLSSWDRSFRTLGEKGRPDGQGMFILDDAGDEDEAVLRPAAARITVPVAVLMGPVNSSATFSFVRRIRESGAARLFGAPSGGNLRGINGGAMFFVTLPGSGLEFDLPLKGYFPERPQPDAPVRPHVAIQPTIADIAAGRDAEMAAARGWLLEA